jgi:hypothetical protein
MVGYSAAVGRFLDEYRNIDSMRSTAYGLALGMISARLTPFSLGK